MALWDSEGSGFRSAKGFALLLPLFFFLANGAFFVGILLLPFSPMVRLTYAFNTVLLPVLLVLSAGALLVTGPLGPEGVKPRRVAAAWLLLALAMVGIRIYATHIEPQRLQVRELTLTSSKITRPFTLLHISDIQSAGIGPYEARVFETIRSLNPDLILDTGDLIQPVYPKTYRSELKKVADLFETLDPPLGMFMVEGDTTGPIGNATPDETGGISYLHSQGQVIEVEGLRLRIFGLTLQDSIFTGTPETRNKVDQWLMEEPQTLNILFGHRPDYILAVNDLSIDLCLAGHTHGGQIRLPFYGPLVTFSLVPRDWARGFREVGQTRLNVSAGIGAEHAAGLPSIRFNCPPEMTLIRFEPVDRAAGTLGVLPPVQQAS